MAETRLLAMAWSPAFLPQRCNPPPAQNSPQALVFCACNYHPNARAHSLRASWQPEQRTQLFRPSPPTGDQPSRLSNLPWGSTGETVTHFPRKDVDDLALHRSLKPRFHFRCHRKQPRLHRAVAGSFLNELVFLHVTLQQCNHARESCFRRTTAVEALTVSRNRAARLASFLVVDRTSRNQPILFFLASLISNSSPGLSVQSRAVVSLAHQQISVLNWFARV